MNKKIVITAALVLILALGLLILTGCVNKGPKIETETLTQEESKYTVSIDVPAGKGYKFVEKLDEKDEYAPTNYPDFILVGDKAVIYFDHNSFVYQTSIDFKEKHPDMDKDNPNFNDFVTLRTNKYEKTEFNGREAIKEDLRYGAGSGELKGYNYYVNTDDIYGRLDISILPKVKDSDINALMEDPEVKVIMDSIKITAKQ